MFSGMMTTNIVCLTRPSVKQSEDVMSKLINIQQTGKEWNISLLSSSPESTAVIINNLNKWSDETGDIYEDPLNSKSISILSAILKVTTTTK